MSDQETKQKTKTVGYLPLAKVEAIKGWPDYKRDSEQLGKLRVATAQSKAIVREGIKTRLKLSGDIDFHEESDRVKVVEVLQKNGGRTRLVDLSDRFR
jgi:hypothetical protein